VDFNEARDDGVAVVSPEPYADHLCLAPHDALPDVQPAVSKQKKVKVKASHTRYRALGPELIPMYRQSACR